MALLAAGMLLSISPLKMIPASPAATSSPPGRYALVVGIDDYSQAGAGRLEYAESDAQAMRDTLVQYGGFPTEHVTLLLGAAATQAAILSYLDSLANRAKFPDPGTFVLYFSGRGGVIVAPATEHAPEERGQCLFPADASNESVLAERKSVELQDVLRLLDNSGFPRQVAFIDACRNIQYTAQAKHLVLQSSSAGFDAGPADAAATGLKLFFAARPGQLAWEDKDLGGSVFSQILLAGLHGAAAQPDGLVTCSSLEAFLAKMMAEYSREHPERRQTPAVDGDGSGAIVLTATTAAQPAPAPPPGQ